MTEPSNFAATDSVAQHAGALRALALSLLRDPSAADDAVQDTWLRWLESPPRASGALSAWLARVLRNRAVNQRRDSGRRAQREHERATPERFDPDAARERDETLRLVVAAVIALDEPFKQVVWMRYFDGAPPREIAKRLGTTREVVYERLRRAHALLRERLRSEFGSDERRDRALALFVGVTGTTREPLAPMRRARPFAPPSPVALVVASVGIVAGVAWIASTTNLGDGGEPSAVVAAASPAATELSAPTRELSTTPTGERRSVEIDDEFLAADAVLWPAPTFEYEVEVQLVDQRDLPVAGHAVYAAPAGGTLNRVGETDRDGVARLRVRGFRSALAFDFSTSSRSAPIERRTLAAGSQRVALRCRSDFGMQLRSSGPDGSRLELFVHGAALVGSVGAAPFRLVTRSGEGATSALVDADGWTTFVEPLLVRCAGADGKPLLVRRSGADGNRTGESAGRSIDLRAAIGLVGDEQRKRRLTGSVRGVDGTAMANTPLHWRRLDTLDWMSASTDDAGAFDFEVFDAAEYDVVLGGGDLGLARTKIDFEAFAEPRWDAVLERGRELRVQLLDAKEKPLVGWEVLADQYGATAYVDSALSGPDGRTSIPNAPTGPIRLRARPAENAAALCFEVSQAAYSDGRELVIHAPFDTGVARSTFRAEVSSFEPFEVAEGRLTIWSAAGESGLVAGLVGATFGPEGAHERGRVDFEVGGLLESSYELEFSLPGASRWKLGPISCASGQPFALDAAQFEPTAQLEVEARPRVSGLPRNVRLVFRADDVLLVSEPFDIAVEQSVAAAPGDYELVDAESLRPIATVELPAAAVRLRRDSSLEPLPAPVR